MKTILLVIFASSLMLVFGCKTSTLTCDYADRLGKKPNVQPPSDIIEVQIKLVKGLAKAEPPGPITTPFIVRGNVLKDQIPKHPDAKDIRLRLYHDWTDVLVKDNAILTLRFTQDGSLFDIKEFNVMGVSE